MNVGLRVKKSLMLVLIGLLSAQVVGATPAQTATHAPAAPAGLTAVPGNGEVGLRWEAATDATSYHLKRATTSGGPYTEIAAPRWNGYTDVGLTNGVTYFFVVAAVGPAGEGAHSVQVSAKPEGPAGSRLPISFFGQSISEIQASHFPTVPFGGVRLWDINTSWDKIETSRGR
jgi:hypothetical protein